MNCVINCSQDVKSVLYGQAVIPLAQLVCVDEMEYDHIVKKHGNDEPETAHTDVILGVGFPCNPNQSARKSAAEIINIINSNSFVRAAPEHPPDSASPAGSLWLPVAIVQHANPLQSKQDVMNLIKRNLISAAAFLHVFGLKSHPVTGLVIFGTEVTVLLTWQMNAASESAYVLFDYDNVETFDIAEPLGCYRFCVLLLRLSQKAKELEELVCKGRLADRFFENTQ
ncbi:hypothetical protein H0H87_010590, partial [Tephrocybe sp. NHM501043]